MCPELNQLRAGIEDIADQLCSTVDGDFDIHVMTKGEDLSLQKLGLLVNFLLDRVRRSLRAAELVNEELDRRVRIRTAELEDARQAAEQANLARTRFFTAVSHELRTPMNAIIGYGEMVREDLIARDMVEQVRDMEQIDIAARHLLTLINNILELSKAEAGQMEPEVAACDLVKLVGSTLATVRPTARKAHNELVADLPDGAAWLETDARHLRHALLNLLSNAVKFTANGRVECRLTTCGDGAAISVHDNGIGMTQAQQKHVFEPFRQADKTIARRFGGTGLGLSITRTLIRTIGGDVEVDSRPGEGSVFTLRLPGKVTNNAGKPLTWPRSARVAAGRHGSGVAKS